VTNAAGGLGNLLQASLTNLGLVSSGAVQVSATNSASLQAQVAAGSAAVALASKSSGAVSLSGAGAEATNRSLMQIQADLSGATPAAGGSGTPLQAGALSVTSSDNATAQALGVAATLAASYGGTGAASVSLTIGVALADNTLNNSLATSLSNLAAGSSVSSLSLGATRQQGAAPALQATAVAVSVAAGAGGEGGVSVAGGGAGAGNLLQGDVTTSVSDVQLSSSGAISITSSADQGASAKVGSGAAAVSLAATGGAALDVQTFDSFVTRGDWSGLGPKQRALAYAKVCEQHGLNPYSQPFAFLRLNGKEVLYALDDTERDSLIKRLEADRIRGKISIQRFKGLGEMNPSQLRETAMLPSSRRLVQLTIDDNLATDSLMDLLLAKKRSGERRDWLERKGNLAAVD
jgi:hypothetical protein